MQYLENHYVSAHPLAVDGFQADLIVIGTHLA
jgi:hypothetical protein